MILSVVDEKSQFHMGDKSELGGNYAMASPNRSQKILKSKDKLENSISSPFLTKTFPREVTKRTEDDEFLEKASVVYSHDIDQRTPTNR